MTRTRSKRLEILLSTARSNPEFASQLVLELPEDARLEMLAELAKPAPRKVAAPANERPGLKKCSAPKVSGASSQLNLFARSVARVS